MDVPPDVYLHLLANRVIVIVNSFHFHFQMSEYTLSSLQEFIDQCNIMVYCCDSEYNMEILAYI